MNPKLKAGLRAVAIYLATNKRARALEWALLLGAFEAVRTALGSP